MPQICFALSPCEIAVALIEASACPWVTAARLAAEEPPSNSTISASTQCLAKIPRARATYTGVCTTLGGETETPSFTLRISLHLPWAAAGASL